VLDKHHVVHEDVVTQLCGIYQFFVVYQLLYLNPIRS